MRRTLNVSERFYDLVSYGADIYSISKTDFCNMLYDSHLDLIKDKCKLIKIEKSQNTYSNKKKKQNTLCSDSIIQEGLALIEDLNPEKAKELKETLKQIRERSFNEK